MEEKKRTPEQPGPDSTAPENSRTETRRSFLGTAGTASMIGGLCAGYGTLGYCALQYLTPAPNDENLGWQFVGTLESFQDSASTEFTASSGVKIVIAKATGETETGFLALSSVCPHLGCQVFWEAAKDRFFCPCHNGTFDASGVATGGPPADAKQSLTQYPTKILSEALYVKAPLKTVTNLRSGST